MFDLIELLFFAYRDFVGDADRLLESYKFGRAHHRVLHFVSRHPGLTIAELLDILKITKQSLSRVLKELLDQNFVEARAGVADRRQRHLFPTGKGRKLALDLAHLQSRRFSRA
ncbi:MAG: MarR family transcriptional regulator, partial [Hyphomicrobiales bacterium]|nr:MarR family transcriptional regulator [Hyphomicrobiales bacterium]